jgi:hypothetical protein
MSRKLTPGARRKEVSRLRQDGWTMCEIAEQLGVQIDTIWRDVKELRRAAARRDPWADAPDDGPSAFIEEAEDALQKVRRAELEAAKKDSGAYVSLLRLEWSMVMDLIKLSRNWGLEENGDDHDDAELEGLSNRELLDAAKKLGIDVGRYEAELAGGRPGEGEEDDSFGGDDDADRDAA